jgi:exopolysaccharide biosynthesis polyprenyl glycosylphosphotransferase
MLSGGVLFALLYVLRIKYISTDVLALQMALCWFMVSSVRIVNRINYLRAFRAGKAHLEVLIVGTGNRAKQMADILIRNTRWGLNIIGYLDVDPSMVGSTLTDGKQVLGVIDDIHLVLKSNVVDEIIVAIPRAMIPNMETIALACEEEGVKLNVMADFFDVNVARIRLVQMGGVPLLALEPVAQDDLLILFKRIIDFTLTALAMPFILPLMLGVGIAIRLDSPGPAFFTQMRVGKNKRLFKMYKFRSMYSDSESRMKEIEHLNEAEGPIFKIKNDPRVTRVGHFIRKFSIDELPQLFNVLLGDMSLVGPRPMSIRDVDLFDKGIQRKRFSMKPGLTCLWQISGRSNLPFEKWLQLDLEYIENWSLATDFKIIFKTIPVVVKGTGAV